MKKLIGVHAGEIIAGRGNVVLTSDTNSACFVIAACDNTKKIGCLAHAMFLKNGLDKQRGFPMFSDAAHAIDEMIDDMTRLGSLRDNIEVCLVAGENVPHEHDDPDYFQNLSSVVELLKERRVKCRLDTSRDIGNQHVALDVASGRLSYM